MNWGGPFTQGGAALALGWNTAAPLDRLDLGSTGRCLVRFGAPRNHSPRARFPIRKFKAQTPLQLRALSPSS
jgi:hypothetical protein